MKKLLLVCLLAAAGITNTIAQCTTANVNWDNMDFLISTGNYAAFVSDARARDQRFAFATANVRIQTGSGITITGENATHTGEAGAFGTGEDISFTTTTITPTTITISFSTSVSNLRFSIFDIDNNQDVSFAAFNGATPVSTTLTEANTSGANVLIGPAITPSVNGTSTSYSNSSDLGTVNVNVAGSVTSIRLTFSTAANDFWISDLQACVSGSFPTNYYLPSQPWPGQPAYVLATSDTNRVHSINMTTGQAKELFIETGSQYVNSMAYDQVSRNLYYTPDDVSDLVTQRSIRKYDFNTETSSVLVSDVATLGIPYFEKGVESGGAAFYDDCLYLGVEGSNTAQTSNRESIIWRIEFDASNNPTTVSQVFAIRVDNGSGTLLHDWADFVIKDGVLYNWNSRAISGSNRVYHYNLQTQALTTYTSTFAPKQNAITWNGTIYELNGSNIRQYNGTTGLTGSTIPIAGTNWVGGSGDGTEAFRPKADFGDAPATYDPAAAPAVHEMDTALRLGNTFDREWLIAGQTAFANSDGADEDAIGTTPILCPCSGNFLVPVSVYNNTGANATLIGWLDYNGNGTFDAGEAQTAVVTSSAVMQTIYLTWTNALTPLPDNAATYLRIRLSSAANGMTTANATGYLSNGEVEDYRILVDGFPLATNLLSFTAKKAANEKVQISWTAAEDATLNKYYIQKSRNGINWTMLEMRNASGKTAIAQYIAEDDAVLTGTTYYRLQLIHHNGASTLTEVKQVSLIMEGQSTLAPNPATKNTTLTLDAKAAEKTMLTITNVAGSIVQTLSVQLTKGKNTIGIDVENLKAGIYNLQMSTTGGILRQQFIKIN